MNSQQMQPQATQRGIPESKEHRCRIREQCADYANAAAITPPLSEASLKQHTAALLTRYREDNAYFEFTAILLNNEIWRPAIAATPYDKRLLLLPKCLRDPDHCPAAFDNMGLLCQGCGACPIGILKTEAETMGYAVLIAEGSPVVMSLIQTGAIHAVLGVSCMDALKNIFPLIHAAAIPSLAIPLLRDGCHNTTLDIDWALEHLYASGHGEAYQIGLDDLQTQVDEWFTPDALAAIPGGDGSETAQLALETLGKAGKRWRPLLAVSAYRAITGNASTPLPEALHRIALAVECFHKASLIHDDIEDDDTQRYGEPTLHVRVGIPIALNVGDFLIGEGYRQLTDGSIPDGCKAELVRIAADGHRRLCLGQGAELSLITHAHPASLDRMLDIFVNKTSPAFAVALAMGAVIAGADANTVRLLHTFSDALGIAYQIHDDIADYAASDADLGNPHGRPTLFRALASEHARAVSAERGVDPTTQLMEHANELMETFRVQAVNSINHLESSALKVQLRRILYKLIEAPDSKAS